MKKILVVFVLFVCSTGVSAQYIQSQGGIVSQGTFTNEETEVDAARKGLDGWVAIGGGLGGFPQAVSSVSEFTAMQFDANFGYNIAPRVYIGAGCFAHYSNTIVSAAYVNLRTFSSPKANSLFMNLRIGHVLAGTICEDSEGSYDYYKPQGIVGGYSMGYLWNRFALEFGLDIIGGLTYRAYEKVLNPYGLDWANDTSFKPALDLFCKLSWRF